MTDQTITVLSLGAGVQSTVLALMLANGKPDWPTPDAAIFADTGWEPKGIYAHLDWLEEKLPYPVYRVSKGHRLQDRVRANLNNSGKEGFIDIPRFMTNDKGEGQFQGRRQCTSRYKIEPIKRKIRELLGAPGRQRVKKGTWALQMFGISTDEATRMRDADVQYIQNSYPLIDLRMSRKDCLSWWEDNYPGRTLRKSACVGCPFHSGREWLEIRELEPEQFADACNIDAEIRLYGPDDAEIFLHARRMPLAQAVDEDARRLVKDTARTNEKERIKELANSQLDLWSEECTGYCGV